MATPIHVKKLGHVVYEVQNLERSRRFWTEIMGFTVSDVNEQGMVFLRPGSDHHTIALREVPEKASPRDDTGLQMDHMAFEVDSLETLFKAREFLQAQGIELAFEGRRGPGGNIGLEFRDPDGYLVEIYYGMDQIGPGEKSRPAEQFHRVRSLDDAIAHPLPSSW